LGTHTKYHICGTHYTYLGLVAVVVIIW